jgi:cytochrome c553
MKIRMSWRCLTLVIAGSLVALAASADERLPRGIGPCLSCHGQYGISANDAIPNLGGQHASYLLNALLDYRKGLRTGEQAEEVAAEIQGLNEAELRAIADFFAKLRAPK